MQIINSMMNPQDHQASSQTRLSPKAKPPAHAPPPPPVLYDEETASVASAGSRRAAPPLIRNYHNVPFDGDKSLRPNTGETNSYEAALFGLALVEVVGHLRFMAYVTASLTLLLLFWTWFWRLITLQWGQLVLSAYLGFCSLVWLAAEIVGGMAAASSEDQNVEPARTARRIQAWLIQNFGLLLHPTGKAFFLFFCATLCWGMGGTLEFVLSLSYLASAICWAWLYGANPELRRRTDWMYQTPGQIQTSSPTARAMAAWSYYASSSSQAVAPSETTSLLG